MRPLLLACALLAQGVLFGQTAEELRRFEEIRARHSRGEAVSDEDRQFAMRIMRMRNGKGGGKSDAASKNAEYAKTHQPKESTGLVPLTELGSGKYKGQEGGLYPGGGNVPPPAHLKAGMTAAAAIKPIDGKIVLLSIGMSNTTQESQAFLRLLKQQTDINPNLVFLDGAQGGQTARITADPHSNYWKVVDERIAAAGLSAKQVQAVWLKQANAQPTEEFPAEAKRLETDIEGTIRNLRGKFPNLKIVYLSSRIYAGYARSALNPEPHAYEGAFAAKWVIAKNMAGEPGPWVGWGPYLWGDGVKARKDGLIWKVTDLGPDGTHPSDAGREKVAKLLLDFLRSDPTAKSWFLR